MVELPVVNCLSGGREALPGIGLRSALAGHRHDFVAAYAHVPFCSHKCHYCDFYSFVDSEDRQAAYVNRLAAECAAVSEFVARPLESIFVGGGTPTLLRPPLLAAALAALAEMAGWRGGVGEFTVEANPDTVTAEIVQALASAGVNRVSMGCQSFQPRLLKALERTHSPESVPSAMAELRMGGICNLNLDLIFAIPGSTIDEWQEDLKRTIDLEPEHISCYGLVYEANTPLHVRRARGEVEAVDEDLEASMYEMARESLASAGFVQYEISNWARPGRQCRHNLAYWENRDWLALGPSASGHAAGLRWKNLPRLSAWLDSGPLSPLQEVESLDADGQVGETFMMGLRLLEGMPLERVQSLLDLPGGARRRAAIDLAIAAGSLVQIDGRLRVPESALLVSDSVFRTLL